MAEATQASDLPGGTVTFLLTDVEGSTRLWEAHGPAMERALARHDCIVSDAVATHRGSLLKHKGKGDSTFAVFARASDAVAAALACQRALTSEAWTDGIELRVRMAAAIVRGAAMSYDEALDSTIRALDALLQQRDPAS